DAIRGTAGAAVFGVGAEVQETRQAPRKRRRVRMADVSDGMTGILEKSVVGNTNHLVFRGSQARAGGN
ncbi:MAG TPA: hypothetical protein VII02_01970, partial [Gemmatimonadaceae bacterium]